ncbi:MAG: hypothetical protein ACFE0Q_17590 [Anaerolineae bacterium]
MPTITWIHADNLNPNQPALHDGHPAVFVWDESLLTEWAISFKRIVFIYECLLELPVVIRRGDVSEQILRFAQEHGADEIITAASPSPRHQQIVAILRTEGLDVHIMTDTPFINYDGPLKLNRFSHYWRKAERYAMQTTDK